MHPLDCPEWEYSNHPRCHQVLTHQVAEVVTALIKGAIDTQQLAMDSRDVHRKVFKDLTPEGCEYFAGHYRGEAFKCLRYCSVGVSSDPRVGVPPQSVAYRIEALRSEVCTGISALDSNVLLSDRERLGYAIALASRVFVAFLTIHPYVNGNGHAGRLIVWGLLGRFGYWPRRWPVHPRPGDPPYSTLIMQCRNGNPTPLEKFLLQTILS
jgi:fido (protein-threonine AMPylation protein)